MHFEADKYLKPPTEWEVNPGYNYHRRGMGTFGQIIEQSYDFQFQGIDMDEHFPSLRRWNRYAPNRHEIAEYSRSASVEYHVAQTSGGVYVAPSEVNDSIEISIAKNSQGIGSVSINSYNSPLVLSYDTQGKLTKVTLQGDFVSLSDHIFEYLPWEEALIAVLNLAKRESTDSLEVDLRKAQESFQHRKDRVPDPDGYAMTLAEIRLNQALGMMLDHFPAGEASPSIKLLTNMGFKEKLLAGLFGRVTYHPQGISALLNMSKDELGLDLKEILNTMLSSLERRSRTVSRRLLILEGFGSEQFYWTDQEEEVRTEIREVEDYDTGLLKKARIGVPTTKYHHSFSAPYNTKLPLLDYSFMVDKGENLIFHGWRRGTQNWTVSNVRQTLPTRIIKDIIMDPFLDPMTIPNMVGILPIFS